MHFEVGVVASRCCALAALAGDDGAALFEGGEAVGSADIEDISVAAQKNGGHVGVARDIAQDAGDELVETVDASFGTGTELLATSNNHDSESVTILCPMCLSP